MTEQHLIEGPVSSGFMASELDRMSASQHLGAHAVFVGTVRADQAGEKTVTGIEYSAYPEMISPVIRGIQDDLFSRFDDLAFVQVYHSTGLVRAGEHSLLVIVSAGHRKQAFAACTACVELIKEKLPVWKKEMYSDGSHHWVDHQGI